VHAVATLLVAEHLNDLLREAEAQRRSALVRSAGRPARRPSFGRVAGLLRRLTGSGRSGSPAARPSGSRPATA